MWRRVPKKCYKYILTVLGTCFYLITIWYLGTYTETQPRNHPFSKLALSFLSTALLMHVIGRPTLQDRSNTSLRDDIRREKLFATTLFITGIVQLMLLQFSHPGNVILIPTICMIFYGLMFCFWKMEPMRDLRAPHVLLWIVILVNLLISGGFITGFFMELINPYKDGLSIFSLIFPTYTVLIGAGGLGVILALNNHFRAPETDQTTRIRPFKRYHDTG